MAVIYYTNFVRVMFTHKGVNQYAPLTRLFLDLFLLTFTVNSVIGIYVAVILPLRGIEDYEEYLGKRVTYFATACGMLSFLR